MSHTAAPGLAPAALVARRLTPGDWDQVLNLAKRSPAPPWLGDLCPLLGAKQTRGWVAGGEGPVVGFALCRLAGPAGPSACGPLLRRALRLVGLAPARKDSCLEAHLLDVRVAAGWAGAAVERALLGRLDEDLRRAAERVEVVVPETSLAAQLFLRDAGYRATEILHGHYGTEDGYRLVWQPS